MWSRRRLTQPSSAYFSTHVVQTLCKNLNIIPFINLLKEFLICIHFLENYMYTVK